MLVSAFIHCSFLMVVEADDCSETLANPPADLGRWHTCAIVWYFFYLLKNSSILLLRNL